MEAIADAGLGILLRCEQSIRGELMKLDELVGLRMDPPEAADPAQFAPPPGSVRAQDCGLPGAPGWRAAKTVAQAAATGLGYAIRHAPRTPPPGGEDPDAPMPADDTAPAGDWQQPATADLIGLLYRAGLAIPALTAVLHEWTDIAAVMTLARSGWDAAAARTPGPLAGALGERVGVAHRAARIRIAGPDRYRIDYLSGQPERKPVTIACDGERRWKVYSGRVVTGPPAPLPREVAGLLDPSWLLRFELSGGRPVTASGRAGLRIAVTASPRLHSFPDLMLAPPGEAVADAGHGFLLRVTSPAGRPAHRFELRDVTLTGPAAAADFRVDIPPGLPVTEDSGGPLGDAELPEAVRLAGKAVTEVARRAAAGASALASFLDSMRGKPPGRAG